MAISVDDPFFSGRSKAVELTRDEILNSSLNF